MLHPAGEDDIRHLTPDQAHPGKDGFHTGDADPVDRHRRHGLRNAGHQGGNAGHIEGVDRFHAAAETDIINDGRVNARPFDRLFHDHASQGGRIQIFQGTAKLADGGPTGGNNNNILHSRTSFYEFNDDE